MSIISFLFLLLPSGNIYLNSEEYTRHTPSVTFDCPSRLQLNSFLGGSTIRLTLNGEKRRFAKDTIYGYRDCQGIDYRFYLNSAYRITDTAGFYVYSYTRLVQGEKIARPATTYFFSAQPESPVQPLTMANLQRAFSANPKFCDRLSTEFRSDAALGNTHKLKSAYLQSL